MSLVYQSYNLDGLRQLTDRILLSILWINLIVVGVLCFTLKNDGLATIGFASLLVVFPTVLLVRERHNSTRVQVSAGICLIGLISIIVFQLRGSSWQVDAHMYYFAALAILSLYCNWKVILSSAAVIALHHFILSYLLPGTVYPGEANLGRIAFHAVIVLVESGSLCCMTYHIRHSFEIAETAQKELELARLSEQDAYLKQRAFQDAAEIERRRKADELAATFESNVEALVRKVANAAGSVRSTAQALSQTADHTTKRTMALSTASVDTSMGVQTVASAANQLSTSIVDITKSLSRAATIAARAVNETSETDNIVRSLASTAEQIGHIVEMIGQIAQQTNLLALNATIEAARAGDAGRGFSIVAGEVKSLAQQTERATKDIHRQISAIQGETTKAVEAIKRISATIEEFNSITHVVASAATEQDSATQEIACSAKRAANGTETISSSLDSLSLSAEATGTAAAEGLAASAQLSDECETLAGTVRQFLQGLRAA